MKSLRISCQLFLYHTKLNVVSYRLQPKDTQNETLLLIDEVQDASSGETLYFTLHYGNFDTGEVIRAEVIYP